MQDHIKLKESIRSSKVWNKPHLLKCFISLLQDANKKGELITSYPEIASELNYSTKREAYNIISGLKKLGVLQAQIITVVGPTGTFKKRLLVTVHHYTKYVIV